MQNQFEIFIQNLLSDKYDILPDAENQFIPAEQNEEVILRRLNISFLILLAGSKHPNYNSANKFINGLKEQDEYKQLAEFYSIGTKLVSDEILLNSEKDISFAEKIEKLNKISFDTHNYEQIVKHFWALFFPEGTELLDSDKRQDKVNQLRENRKINITNQNPEPVTNPVQEMIFTSNVLLTIPLDSEYLGNDKLSNNLKQHLKNVCIEKQKYWYDHPIPIGVESVKNEVIYGLTGLSEMMQFEKSRGNAKNKDRLNCLLSVSVTHDGLHTIAKEYLRDEINKSNTIKDLNVFVFTENETRQITEEILIPIAKKYLEVNEVQIDSLRIVLGVDGEYGRHYSFLKAITAVWQVFVDENIKGTFKIDLDQVFPNDELSGQSKSSVFEHFKSPLWGANGRDSYGNNVDLSMIAGALVNDSDIEKSLFYPDIRFPTDNEINQDEHFFCSKLPQALSTEAEMMEKYNSENIDGSSSVISRVHVTGGTNGILIKALRKYRPFTPSFIGRAEDQAYIMSVLFDGSIYLRYLHKSGLIMRHDKHSFAGEAIKAAETGKIIGDYVRILLFSHYAKMLPWSINRIKSELNPFTGCFITNLSYTIVYLRFVLFINSLYDTENEKNIKKASNLIKNGIPRLYNLIENLDKKENIFKERFITESKGWHLFYDILDIAENQIKANDEWMLDIKAKTERILQKTKIN